MKALFLRRNVGYKLFALMLSVLLYYVANAQKNPVGVRDQYLQPEIAKLPDSLVIKEPPALLAVKVSGSLSDLAALDKKPLYAVVDGSLVKPGANRLPPSIALPPGVSLVNDPLPLAAFVAERKEKQPYAVDVMFSGAAPAGQEYDEGIATPGNVVVQGLANDLKRVGRVVASVEREADELTVERTVELYAQDAERRRVEGVEIVPNRVQVRVNLRPVPTTKNMVLYAETVGNPAPGFRVAGYEVMPTGVLVRGAKEALDSRSSLPVRVEITGLRESTVKTASLTLPPGISPQTALPQVKVRVIVEPIPRIEPSATPEPSPSPAASAAAPEPSPTDTASP